MHHNYLYLSIPDFPGVRCLAGGPVPVTMLLPPDAEGMPQEYLAHAHGNYLIHAYFGGYVEPTCGVYRSKEEWIFLPPPKVNGSNIVMTRGL